MKKAILLFTALLFWASSSTFAQEKYAVLIVSDYEDSHTSNWDRGSWEPGPEIIEDTDEFWNDTYLMWGMLKNKGFKPENIFVLFAYGSTPPFNYSWYNTNENFINDAASKDNVQKLFEDLEYGRNGRPQITENDFLFVWVFTHGGTNENNTNSSFILCDGNVADTTLAKWVNPVSAHRKAFWMQQCHGGGFSDNLSDNNTVFISASQADEFAFRADNRTPSNDSIVENEIYETNNDLSIVYPHGEFNFHMISVINQESPTQEPMYDSIDYSSGDANSDYYISMCEAYMWDTINDSRKMTSLVQYALDERENALYSDIGNIGSHMSFDYPTLLFDSIAGNESHRGIIGISKDLYVADGQTLTITGNSIVTLCNNAKLVIEEGGSLAINGNIRFYGKNDNIIEIDGNFTNNSDTLVFNNLKIQVASENFSISKASFYDTELDYNPLPAHPNPGIQELGSITIQNCLFSNPHKLFSIRLKNTANFIIQNNTISASAGDGIYVANSGNSTGDNSAIRRIRHNTINHCLYAGLVFYASSGNVLMNQIYRNGTGVKLLNNCNINSFEGDCGAFIAEDTQFIHDNDSYEIYLTSNCAPQNMHYNVIADTVGGNTPYIYYDGDIGFGEPPVTCVAVIDVTNNTWGSNFIPSIHLYSTTPLVTYDSLPYWSMGLCNDNGNTDGQRLIASADSLCGLGEFMMAKTVYRQVVDCYPHTTSAATALKTMLHLERVTGQDFSSLQRYYLTDTAIMSDTILVKLAFSLSNKCDEILGNYSKAIAWYEDVITNPNTTFCDSVFATIDLGDLYLRIGDSGEKAIGKLAQFKSNSRAAFEAQCQYALSLLPLPSDGDDPFFGPLDDRFPYWTDTITSQPESYVVDAEGNVEISSSDGLVWLISAVNGLNGCEPDNFDGRTVRLTDDIDFGEAGMNYQFSPIGTRETPFMGTFDGREHEIRNLMMKHHYTNGGACDSDLGFFGYILHATVRNITIDSTCYIAAYCTNSEYCRGSIVGFSDSLSLVDNCHLHRYIGNLSYGSGLVGMNRNSTVRNCSVEAKSFGLCYGAGLVSYNYSTGDFADAVVENCYFYGRISDGSLNSVCTGGLVCLNRTDPNDNGWKAIVRNCHCTPTQRFSENDYGIFAYKLWNGSSIRNCYTDITSFGPAHMVGINQGGELQNCSKYTNINGIGTLELPVTVNGTTTNNLLDALNLWIEEQEHPELYRTWAMVTDSIPVFGGYYVGIPKYVASQEVIKVYPNPTNDQVTITGENLRLAEVVNMLGQHVLTVTGEGNELKINMQRMPSGVYFVTVTDNEGRRCVKKVVKE